MMDIDLIRRSIEAEPINFMRLAHKVKNEEDLKSYVRGYVKRNYNVKIEPPLDYIIAYMLMDVILDYPRWLSSYDKRSGDLFNLIEEHEKGEINHDEK